MPKNSVQKELQKKTNNFLLLSLCKNSLQADTQNN